MPRTASREQRIDSDVVGAYQHVVPRDGAYVELWRVRKCLAKTGITEDERNASLVRLHTTGYARFLPMKREFVGRKDRKAAAKIDGTVCHLVAMGG
jgi:hypothetical protein